MTTCDNLADYINLVKTELFNQYTKLIIVFGNYGDYLKFLTDIGIISHLQKHSFTRKLNFFFFLLAVFLLTLADAVSFFSLTEPLLHLARDAKKPAFAISINLLLSWFMFQ